MDLLPRRLSLFYFVCFFPLVNLTLTVSASQRLSDKKELEPELLLGDRRLLQKRLYKYHDLVKDLGDLEHA